MKKKFKFFKTLWSNISSSIAIGGSFMSILALSQLASSIVSTRETLLFYCPFTSRADQRKRKNTKGKRGITLLYTFWWGHRCVAAAILFRVSFLSRIPSFLQRTDRPGFPGNPFEEENDHEKWRGMGRDRFSRAQKRKKREGRGAREDDPALFAFY